MTQMSLKSLSHVNLSIVLTRADHLFIQKLHKITYKYYVKTYCNGPDEAQTSVILLECLTP